MCDICQRSQCLPRCPNHQQKVAYIGQCVICNAILTTETEAFTDEDDNLFCSELCFKDYYSFKEVNYDKYEVTGR